MLDRTTTNLLLVASLHHLRTTLEPLPVGLMKLNRLGQIEYIDEWSEALLGYSSSDLKGKSTGTIFGDSAKTVEDAIGKQSFGYIGRFSIEGKSSTTTAEIVMVQAIEPHIYSFNIIFSLS